MATDPKDAALVSAQLSVRRGRAAVEFYKAAFGAREVYRVGGTDENEAVVSQLSVGSSTFWVADESPPHLNFSPESLGGGTVRMLLTVGDPDAAMERAIASGATEVSPVAEAHGWRLGRIADPFGHHWEIGKPWCRGHRREDARTTTPSGVSRPRAGGRAPARRRLGRGPGRRGRRSRARTGARATPAGPGAPAPRATASTRPGARPPAR